MPSRRCVGCGRTAPKRELVRIAAGAADAEGRRTARADRSRTMGGRGAYLCAEPDGALSARCAAQAVRRDAIGRTLRAKVSLDAEIVESVGR